jgi:hypothetical protein
MSRTLLLARDSELLGENDPSDDQVIKAFRNTRVLLVADEANLSAPAGQHALVTLVNLVARLGVTLRLAIPEIPLLGFQPPVRDPQLRSGLIDLGNDLLPDCAVELAADDEPADVALVLGDTPWHGRAAIVLRLCGDAWSGWTLPVGAKGQRWAEDVPLGGLAVAGIAAPEVFKYALRVFAKELPHPVVPRFLVPVEAAQVRLAPPDTLRYPIDAGPLDIISGGAITHAVLYTLLHLPQVAADIRIVEPERSDLSNMNRYPLLRRSDCDQLKIDTLASWQRDSVTVSGIAHFYDAATRQQLGPLAPQVLVGVDDIPTRWEVQRAWPEWLGVGATSHFLAIVSSHSTGQPCVGCFHPIDDPGPDLIPTVSFVSYWAGLLLAIQTVQRSLGQIENGHEQSIWCSPLRLDQSRAFWQRPISASPRCPVSCPASREL